ncbi:MAG: HPr family phosphocarrier protein [Desulfuromonadales bacterium]|nr:HPr family phosphocarrier protein [Desulfuromonadales bacterium]
MVISKELLIVNRLGLHARAAAQLVKTANQFFSDITVKKEDEQVNAKSIMGILMLAAACGSRILVTADGEDAEMAMAKIEELVNDGFGES